ncbi:uncharacterized protein LOC134845249 isoform X3 [Symsagittifera roscoffensis]|uniref:uncharacterized protein LOC134845249 isoform X3 n=1 Tax=Symsagittifera roscoffensis TaxID=84072 RepID=UPI00307B1CD5
MGKVWRKIKPSWLSRSHESLVFNSVYSPATNQNAVPVLSNQNADSSHDRIVESSAEYHFNQSNNFPPIHSSHSQYFNSHHLEGSGNSGRKLRNHQHRPSLALDSNENILLQSSTSTNENEASIFSSANHCSQSNLRQLKSSLGGSRLTTLTTDNYLHMNGGPNGMGPVVIGGGGTPSTLAMSGSSHPNRTSSTNNLQQMHHSSTLEKQKLDRSRSTHFKFGSSGGSAFDLNGQDPWSRLTFISANRNATLRQTPISMSSAGANQSSIQSLSSSVNINNNNNSTNQMFAPQQHQPQIMQPMMPYSVTHASASTMQQQHQQQQSQFAAGLLQPAREASSLRMHVLEMKGAPSKNKQKIFCQIFVNAVKLGETTAKPKLDILFWGELFNFTPDQLSKVKPIEKIQIKIFKESENPKKKKKDKETGGNQLGSVELKLKEISGDWNETWYPVDNRAKSCDQDNCTLRVRAVYHTVWVLDQRCYGELLDFLRDDSLLLYRVVEEAILLKEKEDFSTSLIQVLHYCDKIDVFFADVIEHELKKENNPRMVFRGNSLATKSMEAYLKFIGSEYLKNTLQETILEIYRKDESYEIDSQKLPGSNPVKIAEQQEKFKRLCEQIWGLIQRSISEFPWEMQRVFAKIKERLKKEYTGEVVDNIITGSIFLRFLCPAIMTPNLFALHNAYPPDNTVRTLKLVAKLLQALANNSTLGEKESYMTFMNPFMNEQFANMRKFLDDISTNTSVYPSSHLDRQRELLLPSAVPKQQIDVAKECAIIYRMLQKIKDNYNSSSSCSVATAVSRSNNMSGGGSMASASIASPAKNGRSMAQIIQTLQQNYLYPQSQMAALQFPQPNIASSINLRSMNQSPQPMMQYHQQAMLAGTVPANYAPQGIKVSSAAPGGGQYPMTSQSQLQQQYNNNHFAAQPVRQSSVDSQVPMRVEHPNQNQFTASLYPQYPGTSQQQLQHPNSDPMRIKAPTDVMHVGASGGLENTYYNQPGVLLHNSSHHVNSTLPRSNKHSSHTSVNRSPMGGIPGFSMPPPPNYPPPAPGDCGGVGGGEENYENMDVVKMSNRKQSHNSPKKGSVSSSASSNLTPVSSDHQIAKPTSPFQPAMPEQAQRVRLNPSQSNSTINLHSNSNSDQSRQQQRMQQQQNQVPPKSRLGISSLSNFKSQQMTPGKAQSPSGGLYDAADQHYNMSGQAPTASIEPSFKAVSRSANRTPTSEVASLAMSVQYANSETINDTRGSRDEGLGGNTPTAKSPSTVPVQIIPESRNFRSHTPTGGGNTEQRQTSSHGDFMTLANPIYDVYNSDPKQNQNGRIMITNNEDPQSLRRTESVSSDGAISQLSEVESNMIRVQSDSSFPSEFDINNQTCTPTNRHQKNHNVTSAHASSNHHKKHHRHHRRRRFSADSNSEANHQESSDNKRRQRRHGKTDTTGEDEIWQRSSGVTRGDDDSPTTMDTPDEMLTNESLENVFVPQSTTDCLMPSMSFKRGLSGVLQQGKATSRAPVADQEDLESVDDRTAQNQNEDTHTIRDDDSNCNTSQQSFLSTLNASDVPGLPNDLASGGGSSRGFVSSNNSLATISSIPQNSTTSSSSSTTAAAESITNPRRRSQLYGNRPPAVKSVAEYAAENADLQSRLTEFEERETRSQQERKSAEAKNQAIQEDNCRLSQENVELKEQLDTLTVELQERMKMIAKKDEKIKKLLVNNQTLLGHVNNHVTNNQNATTWDHKAKPSLGQTSNSNQLSQSEAANETSASSVTNGSTSSNRESSEGVVSRGRETPTQTNRSSRYQTNGHGAGDVVRISKTSNPLELQNSTPL